MSAVLPPAVALTVERRHLPYYRQLLRDLVDGSMALVERLAAEAKLPSTGERARSLSEVVQAYELLAYTIRRAILVAAMQIADRPSTGDVQEGSPAHGEVVQALDQEIRHMAANAVDLKTLHDALEHELEAEEDRLDDIPGRTLPELVAELCRNLGLATHLLPVHWLDLMPAHIRDLAARSVAAAIRPVDVAARIGHALER